MLEHNDDAAVKVEHLIKLIFFKITIVIISLFYVTFGNFLLLVATNLIIFLF